MKKFISFFILIINIFYIPASYSVEFGQNAADDPNIVAINNGGSGFLYSEQIVFTAAHVLEQIQPLDKWETDGYVYLPGTVDIENAKKVSVAKVFIPDTYVKASDKNQPYDDFAIIVLKESIAMKNQVKIASQEEMEQFAADKTKIEMVGYGIQNGQQRNTINYNQTRLPYKLTSYLYNSKMLNDFYSTNIQKPSWWNRIEWGAIHRPELGSICNGDSGAGFYVEKNNVRYYVGTAGNGLGISNCGSYNADPAGGMSWFSPPYKFLNLLNTAEKYISDIKQQQLIKVKTETEIKQTTDLKSNEKIEYNLQTQTETKKEIEVKTEINKIVKPTTIICFRGKFVKKITAINPKCPKFYSLR